MKKLNLKKETLTELSAEDLSLVAGGVAAPSMEIAITYTCPTYRCVIVISGGCVVSGGCTSC